MVDPWYVVLRDLMIILAALVTVLAGSLSALVAWRLYRLALALRGEIEPILASLNETAATVRDSSVFVQRSHLPSPVTTVGLLAGGLRFVRLVRRLRRTTDEDSSGANDTGHVASPEAAVTPEAGGNNQ